MRALRIAKTWGERARRAICSLGEQQGTDPPDFGIGVRLGGVAERGQAGLERIAARAVAAALRAAVAGSSIAWRSACSPCSLCIRASADVRIGAISSSA